MSNVTQDLVARSKDRNSVIRGQAAEELGRIGDTSAIDLLIVLLKDSDVIVRYKAALALAWLGREDGLDVLVWAMGRQEFCFDALDALAELGSIEVLEDVRQFFNRWHLHPLERMQAAAVLHCLGDETGTRHISDCLDSAKPEEKGFAIELWGRLKMPKAYEFLVEIVDDPNHQHRLDAVRGLAQLGDRRCLAILERIGRQSDDEILAQEASSAADSLGKSA
jgi:HEAT repeat protein